MTLGSREVFQRPGVTQVDAFVKPTIATYVRTLAERLAERTGRGVPFFVMKSNGGVTSAAGVAGKPITTVLSGPAAGALGALLLVPLHVEFLAAVLGRRAHVHQGGTVVADGRLDVVAERPDAGIWLLRRVRARRDGR